MGDVLRASLLTEHGFGHAFNLRTGGASRAPFDSFNLARTVGDEAAHVAQNQRAFAAAVGCGPDALHEVSQVHGNAVHVVGEAPPNASRAQEADALVAPAGGAAVGVRTADCVPVLLADPDSGTAAAVHAGWRGTVRGVLEATLAVLAERGVHAGGLVAAIFPHIRSCCFEVGDDVAAELAAAAPGLEVVDRSRPRPHVDLTAIVRAKLVRAGVEAARVQDVTGCTRCEPERFFSYRRDGKRSGRHVAAIVSR